MYYAYTILMLSEQQLAMSLSCSFEIPLQWYYYIFPLLTHSYRISPLVQFSKEAFLYFQNSSKSRV
jgi:hypothetical protein